MNRVLSFAEFQQCVEAGMMPATFNQPSGFNTGTNPKNDGVAIVVEDDEEDSFSRQRDIYGGSSSFTTRPQPISLNQAQSNNTQAPFSGFPLPPPPVFNAPVPPSLPSLSPPTAPAPPSLHSTAGGMFNKVFPPPPVLPGVSAPSRIPQVPVPFGDTSRQDTGRSLSSNFPTFPEPPTANSFIGRTLSSQSNSTSNYNDLMGSQSQIPGIGSSNQGPSSSSYNQGPNMNSFNQPINSNVNSTGESNFEALDSWRRNDRGSADQWRESAEKRSMSQIEINQGQISLINRFPHQESERFENAKFNNQRTFDHRIAPRSPPRESNNWIGQRNSKMEESRSSDWQKPNENPPWVNMEPERRLSDISNQSTVTPWNARSQNEPLDDSRRFETDRGFVSLSSNKPFEKHPAEDTFARGDNYKPLGQFNDRRSFPETSNRTVFETGRSQNFEPKVTQPQAEPSHFRGNVPLSRNELSNSVGQRDNFPNSNDRFGNRPENDRQSLGVSGNAFDGHNKGRNEFGSTDARKDTGASLPRPSLSAPGPMRAPDSFGSTAGKNELVYGSRNNPEKREQEMRRNDLRPAFDSFKPTENRGNFTPERRSFEAAGSMERNFGGVTRDSGNPNMMPIGGNRAPDRSMSLERARPVPPSVIAEVPNKQREIPRPLMEPIKPLLEHRGMTEREGPGCFIGNRSQSLDRNQSELGRQDFRPRGHDNAFRGPRDSLPNRDQNRNQWQGARDKSVDERPSFGNDSRGREWNDKRSDGIERKQDMPRNKHMNMESLNDEKWKTAKLTELSKPAEARPIPPSRPIEPGRRQEETRDMTTSVSNQSAHRQLSATLNYLKDAVPEVKRPLPSSAPPEQLASKEQV